MKQIFFVSTQGAVTIAYKVTEEKAISVSVSPDSSAIRTDMGTDINQVAKARLANGYEISDEATYNEVLNKAIDMHS